MNISEGIIMVLVYLYLGINFIIILHYRYKKLSGWVSLDFIRFFNK